MINIQNEDKNTGGFITEVHDLGQRGNTYITEHSMESSSDMSSKNSSLHSSKRHNRSH